MCRSTPYLLRKQGRCICHKLATFLGAPENGQLRNKHWKLFGPQGISAGPYSQGLQLPANQSRDPGNGANRCGRAGSRAFGDPESHPKVHTAAASNRQTRPLATTTTERRGRTQCHWWRPALTCRTSRDDDGDLDDDKGGGAWIREPGPSAAAAAPRHPNAADAEDGGPR